MCAYALHVRDDATGSECKRACSGAHQLCERTKSRDNDEEIGRAARASGKEGESEQGFDKVEKGRE